MKVSKYRYFVCVPAKDTIYEAVNLDDALFHLGLWAKAWRTLVKCEDTILCHCEAGEPGKINWR